MKIHGVFTNDGGTAAEAPPPVTVPRPEKRGGGCRYAFDTGERAFVTLPCRGNRIECKRTGSTSYAAACRPDKCNFYEEDD